MINEFAKNRFDQLLEDLNTFEEMGISDAARMQGKLSSVRTALNELREKTAAEGFTGPQEEIQFFKYWKPSFLGRYFYEQEVFKIKMGIPDGYPEDKKNFYRDELNYIDKFNHKHQFLREYYLSGSTELDHLYFLRNATPSNLLWLDAPFVDHGFATVGESLFGKFMCNDWLKAHIRNALADLERQVNDPEPHLRWTGDVVNLVELAYSLWLTGQFNHGNASLNQIVKALEVTWGIHIGIIQRRFTEISARKLVSPTKFIDQMRDALLKKMVPAT